MKADVAQAERSRPAATTLTTAISFYCGLASMALGAAVLLGWMFDIEILKRLVVGLASMKVNTALSFIAGGLALARLAQLPARCSSDRIATGAALFMLLVSIMTLTEYALGTNFGIDQLVIRDDEPALAPGRMSPIAAAALFAAAAALLLPQTPSSGFNARILLWATILVVSSAALFGHVIDVSQLYRIGAYAGIAAHTAAGFVLLALGGSAQSWPSGRFTALLARAAVPDGPGRYILAAVLVLLASWLRYVLGEVTGLNLPYITFYLTIMVIAVFAGPWPGVFATLFSALIVNLYFITPVGQFSRAAADVIGLTIFIISGLVVSLLANVLHRLYRETASARDRSEQLVLERTAALRLSEQHFSAIVNQNMAAIAEAGLTGRFTLVNDRYCELTGYSRQELLSGMRMQDITHPEDLPRNIEAFQRLAETGVPFAVEKRYLRKDGSIVWVNNSVCALRDAEGNPQSAVAVIIDVTERKRAERSAAHLAAIVTSASDAILSKTLDGVITSWNAAAERMFGYTAEEIIGQSVRRLIPPDRQGEEDQILARLRAGERLEHYETVRLTKDGRNLDVSLAISPIRDSSGSIIGASKIAHDIGERKRAEMHRQMLINELNHRVKNTLATVQSIAAQTLRTSPDLSTARERFEARLMALSKAHDVLTRENWESAPLTDIVERAIAPYCGATRDRFAVEGPAIRVTPRHALAIAMALHELCTNAVKYGALSNDRGKVTIAWSVSENDEDRNGRTFNMRWSEIGGPPVTPPERRGFGSRLIERGLAGDLGGEVTIDFAKSGVTCTIVAPLIAAGGSREQSLHDQLTH